MCCSDFYRKYKTILIYYNVRVLVISIHIRLKYWYSFINNNDISNDKLNVTLKSEWLYNNLSSKEYNNVYILCFIYRVKVWCCLTQFLPSWNTKRECCFWRYPLFHYIWVLTSCIHSMFYFCRKWYSRVFRLLSPGEYSLVFYKWDVNTCSLLIKHLMA